MKMQIPLPNDDSCHKVSSQKFRKIHPQVFEYRNLSEKQTDWQRDKENYQQIENIASSWHINK